MKPSCANATANGSYRQEWLFSGCKLHVEPAPVPDESEALGTIMIPADTPLS
ncbi:hypothetical protein [Tsuneonella suprasediminis]|uniref:hypothetical protein n=1 Tax=Tsuneonella suprasediminis TaxID=2306996 RepID=UPI0014041CC9|nr:hypothetical protein [Tsuneonella suprasediminis]